jgi:hypothetical protein
MMPAIFTGSSSDPRKISSIESRLVSRVDTRLVGEDSETSAEIVKTDWIELEVLP